MVALRISRWSDIAYRGYCNITRFKETQTETVKEICNAHATWSNDIIGTERVYLCNKHKLCLEQDGLTEGWERYPKQKD